MFNAVAIAIILLDAWGMVGIWTQKFGFHNVWEGMSAVNFPLAKKGLTSTFTQN